MSPTRRRFMQTAAAAIALPLTALTASPGKHAEHLTIKDERSEPPAYICESYYRVVVGNLCGPEGHVIVDQARVLLVDEAEMLELDNLSLLQFRPALVQILPRGSHGGDDPMRQRGELIFSVKTIFRTLEDQAEWENRMRSWYRRAKDEAVKPRQFTVPNANQVQYLIINNGLIGVLKCANNQ